MMCWAAAVNETLCLLEGYMGASPEDSSAGNDFWVMNFRASQKTQISENRQAHPYTVTPCYPTSVSRITPPSKLWKLSFSRA